MLMRTPRAGSGAPTSLVLWPTRELAVQVADVLEILAKTVTAGSGRLRRHDLDRQTAS